jgi:membrane-bound ClpP family serine protease
MKSLIRSLATYSLALMIAATAFAQSAEVKLKDGSKWRGSIADQVELTYRQQGVDVPLVGKITKVDDLFIVVEGQIAGKMTTKTIFKADIVAMKTVGKAADSPVGTPAVAATGVGSSSSGNAKTGQQNALPTGAKSFHVFVLPMTGTVGIELRYQELETVIKEADKYGPGQIIVLEVDSPGGLVIEMEPLNRVFKEGKKKHRVIAWIKEAISGGAATAIHCDEIYFMPEGTLGAMTMFSGTTSAKGIELEKWLQASGEFMEEGGRSKYIAWAMIDDEALLSYTKDPVTGKVTWFNDTSGEVVLSNEKNNLVFTASTALDSKFSDGTASTLEDLLKQLDLPGDFKVEQFGIELHKRWIATAEKANEEIPLLMARYSYKGTGSGDAVEIIGTRIKIIKDLIGWWDRAYNVARMMLPPKEQLEREIEELRRQLAAMQR